MKNRKLFYIIFIVILSTILLVFFFYIEKKEKSLSESDIIKNCEQTGGVFTKKGTEKECRGLDVEQCYENKNCMYMLGNWRESPENDSGGCREIRTCDCPDGTRFYPNLGCIK